MESFVTYKLDNGIAAITMDDGKANAIGLRMLEELNTALDQAEADKAVVVIAGRPGMFSAGFDLKVFKGDPADQMRMLTGGARLSQRLLDFPYPVIAACTGHAIAMGSFLLMSCDLRIGVSAGARFHVNEVIIGMTVPHFALEVCKQRLSPAYLHEATVTAQPYAPVDALTAGFVDAIVPAEELAASVQEQAERIKALVPRSFAATKRRLRKSTMDAIAVAIEADIEDWASLGKAQS